MGIVEFILALLFSLVLLLGVIVVIFVVELKRSGYLELYLKKEMEQMIDDDDKR